MRDVVSSAVRSAEHVLQLLLGGNEVVGSPSSVPVAPALRCTIFLTSLFFCVYLSVILLRLGRMATGEQASRSSLEGRLAKATEALPLVPVVAILMIATRLRAIQLAERLELGEPPFWGQLCMYGATTAILVRFIVDLTVVPSSFLAPEDEGFHQVLSAMRHAASTMLFGCSGAIVACTLVMEAPKGSTQALGPELQCMVFLTVCYLIESGVHEYLAATAKKSSMWQRIEQQHYGAVRGLGRFGVEDNQFALPAIISLQFPPMICVLLVGIALRAVQLNLEPELWAALAMYITTGAVIMQAARNTANAVARYQSDDKPQHLLGDEAAGPAMPVSSGLQDGMNAFWAATTCSVYIGTAFILASVFAMESKPLSVILPPGAERAAEANHPLSTTMRCVMSLTVVYFGAYLIVLGGSVLRPWLGQWAAAAAAGVQRSLAFAPMLCVMMIGVRLRAMQIGIRDPPQWAQGSMIVATVAVVTQVLCSMLAEAGVAFGGADDGKALASKVFLITLLALRYTASAALFLSVGSLMLSLAWMQPVL
eukprot:gb/GFBE01047161.1/.p1 GENE.gb/GFBE01047161.1/~~gb/GFBE01047161.1/.p1  ORF type:complete len:538 (+),score=123.98 gb/GFBE01047161.1/:1-1614(+)